MTYPPWLLKEIVIFTWQIADMIVDFDGAVGENPINLTKNS